jgi:isoleucyl-tRNA synthetase
VALAPEGQDNWESLRAVRDDVLKALEEARNSKLIGTGLEAQVSIAAPEPLYAMLKSHETQLRYLFIVSTVTMTEGSGNGAASVHVEIKKADGQKCERCWNYSTRVGEDQNYPTVCERCSAVLKEL